MAYANGDTEVLREWQLRQSKLWFSSISILPTNANVYIFEKSSLLSEMREVKVSDWALTSQAEPLPKQNRKWKHATAVAPIGRQDIFRLSEADLIVRTGDGEVQAQGSVGQPYFLTLASRARGDGGQRVKLNLIPGFSSLLSCIFIAALGAYHFWKFTKRLTAKINNKKCPQLKLLTLWDKPLCMSSPGILLSISTVWNEFTASFLLVKLWSYCIFFLLTSNLSNVHNPSRSL